MQVDLMGSQGCIFVVSNVKPPNIVVSGKPFMFIMEDKFNFKVK